MFTSVLIANRGEIAVRIARTLREMGIRAVVVASIPDRRSLAVRSADDWVLLEGYSAPESYLDVDAVIAAAKEKGCDAIHPGYGFLSERADFAERCAAEGITFIGPPPSVLRSLGDKSSARQLAVANGVPVVPGYDGPDDDATLIREGAAIDVPLMVKARGGGGGRGMREVHDLAGLPEAIESARREALSAFGDPGLLLEKLVTRAHHVEVQVLGDSHGNLIHLGERDCSVQRRRQKLIEESPSPIVDPLLRERVTTAALRLAGAAGYVNAGTVEFLVAEPGPDGERPFYFLEVNPRLQVEHPVTEMVTGLDLVELQLRVAAGEPLPITQDEVTFTGHAIEFRINAEDPWDDFKPSSGRLAAESFRQWSSERTDAGYGAGDTVPVYYDSLLAKFVVHGEDRSDALEWAADTLSRTWPTGLRTNAGLHQAVVASVDFRSGASTIDWLEREWPALRASVDPSPGVRAAAAASLAVGARTLWGGKGATTWLADPLTGRTSRVTIVSMAASGIDCEVDGEVVRLSAGTGEPATRRDWTSDRHEVLVTHRSEGRVEVRLGPITSPVGYGFSFVPPPPLPRRAATAASGATAITAPLSGTVSAIRVAEGDHVEPGQVLLLLEAMKMEHRITANTSGTIARIPVRERDTVREGDLLVELA